MVSVGEIISLVGGAIGILVVVVGFTRYLTQREEQRKLDKATEEHKKTAEKLEASERQRDQLRQDIALAGQAGSAVLHIKTLLDEKLQELMLANGATGGSIYAPAYTPEGKVSGLYFVCIEPFNPQTEQLKKKIVPLRSVAGRCFKDGESYVVSNTAQQKDHFREADRISDYRPATTLNVALRHQERTVGVLQLLSRAGEQGFTESDLKRVTPLCEPIAEQLYDLIKNADFVKVLNLGDDAQGSNGSVIIFDLTSSSLLFREFSPGMALKLMNEYFESLCNVAFAGGAVLDNYMGDGALLRFNVAKPQPDHELAAVKAAIDMARAFEDLQSYWKELSPELDKLHFRAGISSGPLLWGNLGHSQFQRLTIIGHPISVAAALCSEGTRTRSVILVSEETYSVVKDQIAGVPCDLSELGKAEHFTNAVYEIPALR